MKTTLDLPDDLVHEARLRAESLGRSLEVLVADFIRQGLGQPVAAVADASAPNQHLIITADGLPQVRCRADAPASRASVQALLALEQQALSDDDLRYAGRPV
jgi:plasmid stability protein